MDKLDLNILKTLISNKKFAVDFSIEYDSRLFSAESWNAANIILNYIKTYKEVPTLRVILERLAKTNNHTLTEYMKNMWSELDLVSYDEREYKHDLELLKKRFAERQIFEARDKLSKYDEGAVDISRAIGDLQKTVQSIKDLNRTKVFNKKTLKEAAPIFREEYTARMENPNFGTGILTGYRFLDLVTDGVKPSEMLLVAAESGGGKSMLLSNLSIQMWLQKNKVEMEKDFTKGYNILYFSLEMPFKPCMNRVLGRLSNNRTSSIRRATLNQEEIKRLKLALRFIKNYPYTFEIVDLPSGATIQTIEQIYEESKLFYTPDVVVVDYLGLMKHENSADLDDWLSLGHISESLHEFARIHNCVVLSAVQLNRAKGKEVEDKIGMHRIGRSALIMHNADIGLQINKRQNEEKYPDMDVHVIKMREGHTTNGRLIKCLANATILDDEPNPNEVDPTEFVDYDVNDISEKMKLLDI
jgi:replicative DNA helicase